MANYIAKGNKIVKCCLGRDITTSLSSTGFQCPNGCADCTQNHMVLVYYFGTITDKNGNYIY